MAERQQTREEFKAELAKAVDSMEETVAMLIKTGQMLSSINERYHQGEGPVRDVRLVEEEDDGFKVRFTLVNRALMNVSDLGCGFESDKVWTAEKIALRILDFAYRIWTS